VQVSGPHAGAILNAGCPLDLDPAEFPPDMCTRTLLGKAEIVLWRTGGAEFHLEVWRSFSDYVLEFLREAAQDFVAPVQ
jgi:sarcosine oxidase subunit gamma